MATRRPRSRRAFTCGFGPGHHAHPYRTPEIAAQAPTAVRILDLADDGTIVCAGPDGVRGWWHHDRAAAADVITRTDGIAFLYADRVLRIGDRLLSVADEPTPCHGVDAHLDVHHAAWTGTASDLWPLGSPEPRPSHTAADAAHRTGPGHSLSFSRLEAALAAGPGTVVEILGAAGSGVITLEVDGARVERFNHNPARIRAARAEWRGEQPYRYPRAAYWHDPLDPDEPWAATDFGDAPEASLLDGDVLRVGDCYFWLGPADGPWSETNCGYLDDPSTQYIRQKNCAMFVGVRHIPAPHEAVWLRDIACRALELDVKVDRRAERARADSAEDDPDPTPDAAGFLIPVAPHDTSTEEGRDAFAATLATALRGLIGGFTPPHENAFSIARTLYGERPET